MVNSSNLLTNLKQTSLYRFYVAVRACPDANRNLSIRSGQALTRTKPDRGTGERLEAVKWSTATIF